MRRLVISLFLLLTIATSSNSTAQSPLTLLADDSTDATVTVDLKSLTLEERRAMLGTLSDVQVRQLILNNWEQQASAQAVSAQSDVVSGFHENLQRFRTAFRETLGQWRRLPDIVPFLFNQLIPYGQSASILVWVLLGCVAIFAVAFVVERVYLRAIKPFRDRINNTVYNTFTSKLGYLFLRFILRLTGVGIFALVAIGSLFVVNPPSPSIRVALLTYIVAIIIFRVFVHASRFLLAPHDAANRLTPLSDSDANALHVQVVCVVAFGAFVFPTINLIRDLGMDKQIMDLAGLLAGAVFVFGLIYFLWQDRKPIARILRGDSERTGFAGWCREVIAQLWHIVFTIAVLLIWVTSANARLTGYEFSTSAGFGTLLVLVLFPLISGAIRQVLAESAGKKSTPANSDVDDGESLALRTEAGSSTATLMQPVIGLVMTILAILTIAWFWGVNLTTMAANTLGGTVLAGALDILIVLVLAYVIWVIIARAMQPYMPAETASGPGDEGGGTGASRISTLMPLFRKFAFIALVIITAMVILSSLGVNIGPLIAGAGVIGIAIGFGAQSLVRDVISGAFFLMDDAFRKGEYIRMDNIKGTVENISIRSFQLRHHNGPIHTIPYGEIKSVTNYSRDWAIMKFEIRIPFETDVDMVRRLIKKVGQKMMEDEEFGPLMIEPMKSQGVNRMDDSALIVRCKFTAIPGQQFYVRREAFRRIQEAFAQKGLQFAPRRVIVETVGTTHDKSIAAAAAGSIDNPTPTTGQKSADDRG